MHAIFLRQQPEITFYLHDTKDQSIDIPKFKPSVSKFDF